MTEPKPIYNTLDDNELAKIHKASINGEPLSTEQLHELIVSQSMTIDTALTRNGELVDALKQLHEIFKNGDFTTKHINDIINKALG